MKTLAIVICLFCSCFSYAQLTVGKIKTEADIEAFIKQYGVQRWPDWKSGFFMHSIDYRNAEVKGEPDSSVYCKWIIDDFNNDGQKDLLFGNIRKYESASSFFSLMSNQNSGYDYFNLRKHYHYYYTFDFNISKKDSTTLLYLKEHRISYIDTTSKRYTVSDTLIAAFGGFFEKPKLINRQAKFDTLQFEFSYFPYLRIFMRLPQGMTLTIAKDKTAIYEEDGRLYSYIKSPEIEEGVLHFKQSIKLNDEQMQEIIDMFSFADFKQSTYVDSIGGSHLDRVTLRIKTRKKEKIIIDDGLEGSYWLKLFYTKMFAIAKLIRADTSRYFQYNNFELYK